MNGQYLATLNPFGTEIDNQSPNAHYEFQGLSKFLKVGRNTITFRTEVWGHGSFMFGRGTIIRIERIELQYNQEGLEWQNTAIQRTEGVKGIGLIKLQ